MNIGSTLGTAIVRGLYLAIGTGVLTALPVYATSDEWKPVIVAGLTAALIALGFRGGVEGIYDANRQRNDDVRASDVKVG